MATKKKAAAPKPAQSDAAFLDKAHVPAVSDNEGKLISLDPTKLLTLSNVRYVIDPIQVKKLSDSIVEAGGINTPIEVEELPAGHEGLSEGFTHSVTVGHKRVAAALAINKEHGAGTVMVPAVVHATASPLDRIKRQVSENNDRENMSLMDIAYTARKLLDMGVPKIDVRAMFARPGGKKSKLEFQEASNSWLNIVMSFVDYPKNIRDRIADGRIGIKAAMEFQKHEKAKWPDMIASIEASRVKEVESEEAQEAKFLELESKAAAAAAKVEETRVAVIDAEAKAEASGNALAEAETALKEAKATLAAKFTAMHALNLNKDTRKVAETEYEAAEKEHKSILAAYNSAVSVDRKNKETLEKLTTSKEDAAAKAKQKRDAAEKAKADKAIADAAAKAAADAGQPAPPVQAPNTPISPAEVTKAAEATGAAAVAPAAKLNIAQIRDEVHKLTLAGTHPLIQDVMRQMEDVFNGLTSGGDAYKAMKVSITKHNEAVIADSKAQK